MKIIEAYSLQVNKVIKIDEAQYVGDYTIRLTFDDGKIRLVDFKSFLSKAQHPSIKKYLKEKLFSTYKIIDGNLNWNDYELIFPIWDLYKGEIKA